MARNTVNLADVRVMTGQGCGRNTVSMIQGGSQATLVRLGPGEALGVPSPSWRRRQPGPSRCAISIKRPAFGSWQVGRREVSHAIS